MGVPAAPNRSDITARVLSLTQSPTFADKWQLELEVINSETRFGGDFAQAGKTISAFTFEEVTDLKEGSVLKAQAEFVGDARGGQFQITRLRVVESE